MSEIKLTRKWFSETGQIPQGAAANARQAAFYLGMQCEELAEKLHAALPGGGAAAPTIYALDSLGKVLKDGGFDAALAKALGDADSLHAMLDGDADLLWVTIGAAAAAGFDLHGAYGAVADANWNKKWPDGTFHRDPKTGKVLKPAGWIAPNLKPYTGE